MSKELEVAIKSIEKCQGALYLLADELPKEKARLIETIAVLEYVSIALKQEQGIVVNKFNVRIGQSGTVYINDLTIDDEVQNEQMANYEIWDRREKIEDLEEAYFNVKESDRPIVRGDINYLLGLTDDIILSSILTNEYLSLSETQDEFNGAVQEIVDCQEALDSKKYKLED